jgi:LacI family transcriptional regulator
MSKINLETIAKELNLSIASVSKALNDSFEISFETKKRVLEKAKQLNYKANPFAIALRNKKTHTIAVVFPEMDNNFFSLAIKGIESIAFPKGYHILIYPTNENFKREKATVDLLLNGRVDGVLISLSFQTKETAHINNLITQFIPVVLFDRVSHKIQAPKVITDDYESAYSATKHLINGRCRRIVFLSFSEHLEINNRRMDGYKRAIYEKNLNTDSSLIIQCSNNEMDNNEIIKKLLIEKQPDAIFASVEKLIAPCYKNCKELNLNIPDDIKLIGYSSSPIARFLNPSLSTIVQPAFKIGQKAASILLNLIDKKYKKPHSETVVFPSEIQVRESTKNTEYIQLM